MPTTKAVGPAAGRSRVTITTRGLAGVLGIVCGGRLGSAGHVWGQGSWAHWAKVQLQALKPNFSTRITGVGCGKGTTCGGRAGKAAAMGSGIQPQCRKSVWEAFKETITTELNNKKFTNTRVGKVWLGEGGGEEPTTTQTGKI